MGYLIDTNVLSELRKGTRAMPSVRTWYEAALSEESFVSAMTLGELRNGIERLRGRDPVGAYGHERWLDLMLVRFENQILSVTFEVADVWGRLCPTQRLPVVDGLLAATALVHDLTLVTRNTRDFERSGARLLNPFS